MRNQLIKQIWVTLEYNCLELLILVHEPFDFKVNLLPNQCRLISLGLSTYLQIFFFEITETQYGVSRVLNELLLFDVPEPPVLAECPPARPPAARRTSGPRAPVGVPKW